MSLENYQKYLVFLLLCCNQYDHILKNNLSNNILNTEQLFLIPHTTVVVKFYAMLSACAIKSSLSYAAIKFLTIPLWGKNREGKLA